MDRRFGEWMTLSALAVTLVAGLATLLFSRYHGWVCFGFPGGGGGCESYEASLATMITAHPIDLLWPVAYVGMLVGFCVIGWSGARAENPWRVAFAATMYGLAILASLRFLDLRFAPGAILLFAALAPRIVDAAVATTAAGIGWLASIAAWQLFLRSFESRPGGIDEMAWLYIAYGTLLGAALGAVASAARLDWPFSRGMITALGTMGLAALVASLPLLRELYPEGEYVNLGIQGLWHQVGWIGWTNVALGTFGLRVGLRAPWSLAFSGSVITGLSAFLVIFFAWLISSVFPPLTR